MSLAVFDIFKVVEKGVEITPEVDHTSGTIRCVVHLIASAVLVLMDVLPAIPNPSSAPLSLALRKPLRSFSRMPIIKGTKMIFLLIYLSCMMLYIFFYFILVLNYKATHELSDNSFNWTPPVQ
jgi:hypothetical protein